jgi:hypothetical protein
MLGLLDISLLWPYTDDWFVEQQFVALPYLHLGYGFA